MSRIVRVTEENLRAAMRDERYWHSGNPERHAFSTWVADGYRGLYPADGAARGSVWVEAYTRNGRQVAAHWRGARPGTGTAADAPNGQGPGDDGAGGGFDDNPDIVPANWSRVFGRGGNRAPADGRGHGSPSNRPTAGRGSHPRREDDEGNDRVDDLRGAPGTRPQGQVTGGVDQWNRPGGEIGRQQDLDRLRPIGPPVDEADGVRAYPLPGGRRAVIRPGSHGEPTMEIQVPGRSPGRFNRTDKFRYPPER